MDESCPRCGALLQPVDHSPPVFCSQCGLPQLRVSEDAVAQPVAPGEDGLGAQESSRGHRPEVAWPRALRIIALAALIGVVPPMLLPGALTTGEVSNLSLMLTPLLSMVTVSIYYRGRPRRTVNASVGSRMGAVLGLMMGALVAFATGVAGFVLRYGYRSTVMDQRIDEVLTQLPAQLKNAGPMPPELMNFLQSPEFRAGSFIMGHVLTLLVMVAVSAVCGWIAGGLLWARRRRQIG
jgi:hypothetical protein